MSSASAELIPFVPRITVEWLQDNPELRWLEADGTISFVDISGFTAMSERLSNIGRAGAEEVTDVMNATFSALLDVAYAEGGGLLKFGGDALLLLYDGDDHAARAARAAFEMRRTLRAIGRPRTSAGSVMLKMHAGLHSGRFQFFLVGGSHRELLVTGPARDASRRDGGSVGSRRDPRQPRDRRAARAGGARRRQRPWQASAGGPGRLRETDADARCGQHADRGGGAGAAACAVARGRTSRGRAPACGRRVRPVRGNRRDRRDGGRRGGGGSARGR